MHEFIRYALRCIKRARSTNFRQQVLDIGKTDHIWAELLSTGKRYNGKAVYKITAGSETLGFFALFRELLFYLAFADYFGMVPVIAFCDRNLYQEAEEIEGTRNVFEYYFDQPGDLKGEYFRNVVEHAALLIPSSTDHYLKAMELNGLNNCNNYKISSEHFALFAAMIKKYISINQKTQAKLDRDTDFLKDSEWIGVHYRGGDYKANFKGHPKSIQLEDVIKEIRELSSENETRKIFLATDDLTAIEIFKTEFGTRVYCFEDVRRTDGVQGVHTTRSAREHDKYLLGYEVLRDMYALSQCKVLVSGVSQVSMCAKMFKMSKDEEYERHIIIDAGINKEGKEFTI